MTPVPGFTDDENNYLEALIRRALCRETAWSVSLFGSRAKGTHRRFSDVDLLVDGCQHPESILKLSELLEESSLPYIFEVVRSDSIDSDYRDDILSTRFPLLAAESREN